MFKLSEAAEAVGVELRTLSGWLDRRIIDIPGAGSGTNRRFGRDDVIRVGLISDLVRLGVSVSEAAKAASAFCDDANGDRDASELFPSGKTFLFIDADGARVVNVDASREQFESAMQAVYSETHGAIVVNVGLLVERVDRALASGTSKAHPPAGAVFRHGKQLHI